VHPTEKHADLVVSGEQPFERSTTAVMQALRRAKASAAGA
jgi:hypothetical protein